jgi:dienelactone hydrolase
MIPKVITGSGGTIVTMRRRTLLVGLAAGATGLAACGTAKSPAGGGSGSTAPILASTTGSTLAPRGVTPYVPAPGHAPGQAYAVGTRDLDFSRADRALPTRVWYPEGTTGPLPTVLFSHGLTAQPADYQAMLIRWAQVGFVVAAPKYPHTSYGAKDLNAADIANQPADASAVIDQLIGLGPADPLGAMVDPNRLAAAGHSAGGITTVGLFSAVRDKRLKAGIVQAGTDFRSTAFTGPPAAMLFVHSRGDETVAYKAGHTVFNAVPWSRAMLTITDGGHVTSGADFEAITTTGTEFLRWSVYGDATARSRMPAAAAKGGVATLEDQL